MILVSACLAGLDTKYNGKSNYNEKIEYLIKEGKAIIVCPEQLGGLTTPRNPCEICSGDGIDVINGKSRILDKAGNDYTDRFMKGANETLKIARLYNVKSAILKANSPSCGRGKIYDGSFSNTLKRGNGVVAEILLENGINVFNEDNFPEEL